jgi:hypothetical protein
VAERESEKTLHFRKRHAIQRELCSIPEESANFTTKHPTTASCCRGFS